MLSTLRPETFSPFWRVVYIVSAHLVLSYILFDVLDLDGSNFPRFFASHRIVAVVVPPEAELFDFSGQHSPWHSNLFSSGDEASPQPAHSSALTPLSSARAHGYKVSLARNSLSDSSPYG